MWEELGLLFDSGELNDQERRTFGDHLAQCSECRQELDTYNREKATYFNLSVLGESPSAACDAEILRVCSDGRKKVTSFQLLPSWVRTSVVSLGLFLIGFSVVGYLSFKSDLQSRHQAGPGIAQTTIKAPASSVVAESGDIRQKDSSLVDSAEQQNPVNYANTRGNLDGGGVYPVDLQNK
jgi:anti-sigma factor RsiW